MLLAQKAVIQQVQLAVLNATQTVKLVKKIIYNPAYHVNQINFCNQNLVSTAI